MALKLEEIKVLIKESIPDAEITIQDLAGDENHYSATIKSKIFTGKSKIEQHKLVYILMFFLQSLKLFEYYDNAIHVELEFDNFKDCFSAMSRIAFECEALNL